MNDFSQKNLEELTDLLKRSISRSDKNPTALHEVNSGLSELKRSLNDLNQKFSAHLELELIHRDQINGLLRKHDATIYGESGDNGLVLKLSALEQEKKTTEKNIAAAINLVRFFGTTGFLGFMMAAWNLLLGKK